MLYVMMLLIGQPFWPVVDVSNQTDTSPPLSPHVHEHAKNLDHVQSITDEIGVTLYEHCNFEGNALTLPVGDYDAAALIAINKNFTPDKVSAITIPVGLQVTLYDKKNFKGASRILQRGSICLVRQRFNDRMDSLRVRRTEVIK